MTERSFQDLYQRAGVDRAVAGVICETGDIGHVLEVNETPEESSGDFNAIEKLGLHYTALFPDMTQAQGARAVAVFRKLAKDPSLSALEEHERPASGVSRK